MQKCNVNLLLFQDIDLFIVFSGCNNLISAKHPNVAVNITCKFSGETKYIHVLLLNG